MKKKNILFRSLLIIAIIQISSCASYKNIPYFQDLNKSEPTSQDITNYTSNTIQPQDELLIDINSLNPEASAVFNNSLETSRANVVTPLYEYLVDSKGELKLPLLGTIKVSGLTTEELSAQLSVKLKDYLKEAKVLVRIINFKVAVLGDVARPNTYNSFSERLTITEALSMAGDLNITADRDKIILVREVDGKRKFYPVDLSSVKLFQSPYFYLKSNDLIYVQPSKLKTSSIETAGYRNASLVISSLSVVVTFLYLILHK